MRLIRPGGNTCKLRGRWHGAAMIGSVLIKVLDNLAIAGDETGSQARQIGTFRETVKHDAMAKPIIAHLFGRLEQANGRCRFVKIQFGITFIRGNHKIITIRQLDQCLQLLDRHDASGRIAWRADIH